jgi:hypothetical protein
MTFNAQVWAIALLATFASVSCRPEQLPNPSPQEPVLALRSGDIQMLPEDEAVRNSRAYTTREGNDALEHRALQEVKTLEYYGGAKGQYLIIHPSGQMFVSRINIDRKEEEGEEEDVGMEEGGLEGGSSGGSDSVTIKPPPDNASIAEAKPVALAIAGVGGVASSRPTATAIVGPGGLAIARPVATSIAGVGGSGSPPIVISPAHGGLQPPPPPPPSAGAYLNSIEPHPFFYNTFQPQPDFHYPHPHHALPPQQPLFVYPYGYPIPQVK